ncbi:techylectin-5B-like [Mytilus edulis]|uniref:techylectin-5B-like n=1 Tax=Mytilus edulis TaxID=6550 RepID=UPI0039F0724F
MQKCLILIGLICSVLLAGVNSTSTRDDLVETPVVDNQNVPLLAMFDMTKVNKRIMEYISDALEIQMSNLVKMKLEEVLLSLEIGDDVKQYIENMKGNLTVNIRKEIKDYFDDMKQSSTDAISEASRTAEENIKKEIKDYFDDMKQESTDSLSEASRNAEENIKKEIKDYFNDMKQNSTDAISEASKTAEEDIKKEMKTYFNDMKQNSTDAISEASRTAEENIKKEIKDYFDDMKQNFTDAISEAHIHWDCSDLDRKKVRSGVYKMFREGRAGFNVYCDMETDGGGWTVFQHRQDGKVDFYRGWSEYVKGFGDVNTEFWLGNDNLHDFTSQGSYELRVDLEDFNGDKAYAKYSTFNIGDQSTNYILTVNGYSGTAGDSLKYHNNRPFSTKDKDNDSYSRNCAVVYKGAGWNGMCNHSNLNGLYLGNKHDDKGMRWLKWRRSQSMKTTSMMIRRIGL